MSQQPLLNIRQRMKVIASLTAEDIAGIKPNISEKTIYTNNNHRNLGKISGNSPIEFSVVERLADLNSALDMNNMGEAMGHYIYLRRILGL